MKYLLLVIGSSLLLSGCSTTTNNNNKTYTEQELKEAMELSGLYGYRRGFSALIDLCASEGKIELSDQHGNEITLLCTISVEI